MAERRRAKLVRAVAAVGAALTLFAATPASAAEPGPLAPVGPFGEAIPTPVTAFPHHQNDLAAPGADQGRPPFTSPLPPSIPLPPAAPILPGLPPPPTVPMPFRIPERPQFAPPPAGGLRQTLSEHDRRLGLGPAGPVLTAARSLAEGSRARGSAVIAVRVEGTGQIAAARVTSSSQSAAAWGELATRLASLSVRAVRLPEAAKGAWMVLRIEAEPRLPAGERLRYPGVLLAFDVANAGARPVRMVTARVLSELWY